MEKRHKKVHQRSTHRELLLCPVQARLQIPLQLLLDCAPGYTPGGTVAGWTLAERGRIRVFSVRESPHVPSTGRATSPSSARLHHIQSTQVRVRENRAKVFANTALYQLGHNPRASGGESLPERPSLCGHPGTDQGDLRSEAGACCAAEKGIARKRRCGASKSVHFPFPEASWTRLQG